jgi:hypothetical protein
MRLGDYPQLLFQSPAPSPLPPVDNLADRQVRSLRYQINAARFDARSRQLIPRVSIHAPAKGRPLGDRTPEIRPFPARHRIAARGWGNLTFYSPSAPTPALPGVLIDHGCYAQSLLSVREA